MMTSGKPLGELVHRVYIEVNKTFFLPSGNLEQKLTEGRVLVGGWTPACK